MNNKQTSFFRKLRALIFVLFTIYQLFSLCNIQSTQLNTTSASNIITTVMTIILLPSVFLLIYLIPILFYIAEEVRIVIPGFKLDIKYRDAGKQVSFVLINIFNRNMYQVLRC